MKKFISLLIVVLLVSFCNGQTLGVKGGLNISTLQTVEDNGFESGDELSDNVYGSGFNAGVYYIKHLNNEKMHVRAEMLYSTMNVESSDLYTGSENLGNTTFTEGTTRVDLKTSANYLSIPILFQYDITDKISIQAGPAVNYLISSKEDSEISNVTLAGSEGFVIDSQSNCCESLRSVFALDLQAVIGVEFEVAESMTVGLRYNKGFSDYYGLFNDSEDFFEAEDFQFVENARWNALGLYMGVDLIKFSKKEAKAEG
jgi:opacity protein-like surface antigen